MYKTAEEKKRILQHIQGWAELTANKANEMLRLLQATFSKEELEEFKSNELDLKDDLIQTLAYFHHLFDHTEFAITDFIYVREFYSEIKVEIIKGRQK